MVENAEDLADPNNAAAAYMKLQADVKQLILTTLTDEIRMNPYGQVATVIKDMSRQMIDREIHNYRIAYKGTPTNY